MAQHMQEFCVGLTSYVALLQGVSGAEASSIALRAVALIRAATTSRGVLRSGMYELYEVRSLLWDSLHYVHWKDTCDLERELYTVVTAVLVATVLQSSHSQPLNYETLAQTLDIGLLMGSPSVAPVVLPLLSCIQSQLCSDGRSISRTDDQLTGLRRKLSEQRIQILNQHRTYTPDVSMPSIERNPSVVSFYRRYFEPQLPLVLTSCMDDWPALKPLAEGGSPRWANLNYLLSIIGHRTVPVETGSSYLGADSGSSFMTGRQFVEKYILGSSDGCADSTKQPANAIITNNLAGADAQSSDGGVGTDSAGGALAVPAAGYLAQHRLLDQIPRLKEDIITPDYCALLSEVDETTAPTGETAEAADEVKVQAWLGPVGTVSPLHHDPYYNLLAQVTGTTQYGRSSVYAPFNEINCLVAYQGYKYIRIYNPRNSACLCPMPGRMSNNR